MAAKIVPEAISRYFEGVNNEDWDDLRGIWHEDAAVDVVGGMRFRGVDEIMEYYPRVLANFPVHHDDPYGIHVAGEVVTVEIAFEGETAEGVPAAWEAVDVFHLRDGRVERLATWYDLEEVVAFLRRPGPPERRLARVLAAAGLPSLEAARPVREAPAPETIRVLLPGGKPVAAADWEERVRLWSVALAIAGGEDETVAIGSHDPAFAEAAGRERRRFAVLSEDATRTLDVLTWAETGPVAAACGRGGYHVLADGHLVEILHGELLVTPLSRREPLVRFAPGLHASWLEGVCACGSELPRIRVAA
jgi:hypothetical protein